MKSKVEVTAVRFTHAGFKWSLVAFLGVLFLLNALALLAGVMSSLGPVLLQGALLWLIFDHHRKVRLMVRVWCAVLLVTGLYGLVSRMGAAEVSGIAIGKDVVVSIVAAYFLLYAGRYIEDVKA